MIPLRTAVLAASTALTACAGRPIPPTPGAPRPFAAEPWASPHERGHPLVGYVLSVGDGRWVDAAELDAALAGADWVFLGETHDNVDHHRLQARFLRAALAGGRRPALAFEMLDTTQADALARVLSEPPVTPDAVAKATDWDRSGWPPFEGYRPIFEVGLEAGLELVAANLPRSVARDAVRKGVTSLPEDVREAMERAGDPTSAELAQWAEEMEENHCQELDPGLLKGLVLAQRARDAAMAIRLATAGGERGAVLITGGGHARTDRGVPAWLERVRPGGGRRISIALVEADGDHRRPRDYAEPYGGDLFPFDYVVFTARAEREDPCESLRKRKRDAAAKSP